MKRIVISTLTLAFLAATPALADNYGGKGKWDANGDGMISKTEFMAAHEARFAEIDADNDGNISKDEMKSQREARKEKMKERRANRQSNND